jgi:TRAP-type C4-dicarboxylate transport system permease small subunit
MDWLKIVSALMLVAMMFMLYPSLKHASKNSPEATKGDWIGVIKPLVFVVVFVIALIILVR